ncbi:MAG: histidinol-phosphate transaminase [Leptospiraceae bacterium]|nr:histidinol-phosphate transaminase [Leptospiraceae bacterium]
MYKVHAYTPGEQPTAEQKIIKLNTNENPYPPSPTIKKIAESILKKGLLRKYPNPISKALVDEIALQNKVGPENVLVTNGSDEGLALLFKACLGPNSKLIMPYPTYSLYPVLANIQMNGVNIKKVPLLENLHIDFSSLKKQKGNLLTFANPNAPTGLLENKKEIESLLEIFKGIVLCDEAYIDFAPQTSSMVDKISKYDNLVVSRTFSKSYSLAGLRVGFLIANKETIRLLYNIKDSYNVGMLEQEIALAALKDKKYFEKVIKKIIKSRENLGIQLTNLSFTVISSSANFLFIRPPKNISPEHLFHKLKNDGIFVRYFKDDVSKNFLRITVGTEKENKLLIKSLKKYL